MPSKSRCLASAVAAAWALAALVLAPAATAAPPPNDAYVTAQPLAGMPVVVSASNVGATVEPGEPRLGGASVWYTWTPPAPGTYQIATCGSEFDTVLGVFTGDTLPTLIEVARD